MFFALIFSAGLLRSLTATLVSASNVTKCPGQNSTCVQQLGISLTIDNGQRSGAETLAFNISNFTDDGGNVYFMSSPITLTVQKTAVKVVYPVSYQMNFPASVSEKIKRVSWPLCSEGEISGNRVVTDSTCGFKMNAIGAPIPYSGGFCCTCPLITILTGTSSSPTRGNCSAANTLQSAHCLTFSSQSYSAYTIGDARYDFNITVTIDFPGTSISQQQLTISPSSKIAANSLLQAQMIGSFAPTQTPPTLSNKLLMRPVLSKTAPDSQPVSSLWLFVERSQVTFDGSECNKIGVNYAAFQNQNNKCSMQTGSCLANQITDLLFSDSQRISAGLSPNYMLSSFGNFSGTQNIANQTFLSSTFNTDYSTLISLTLNATQLKFVVNPGTASILSAKIADFQSHAAHGTLSTVVQNTGPATANFDVSVLCSDNVQSVGSKRVSLEVGQQLNVTFDIYALSADEMLNLCNIKVMNALGRVVAQTSVNFTSQATVQVAQNTTNTGSSYIDNSTADRPQNTTIITVFSKDFTCSQICGALPSSFCYIANGCFAQVIQQGYITGFGLLIATGLFLLIAFWTRRHSNVKSSA